MLAVFSDPTAPTARVWKANWPSAENVSIYTFRFPWMDCIPRPREKQNASGARLILPRRKSLDDDRQGCRENCATPIARINQLANSLGINGTPMIIFRMAV